ncbi:MAG: translation elongation factor Ts [Chloroflexota bacterium]
MSASAEQIKALRQATGAGVLDCRTALEQTGGDLEKAAELLRQKGLAAADKLAEREAREGMLELYSHGDGRVGVMVEVNCETDFVGRTTEFRRFAHEIALQVAANGPRWIDVGDVPPEVVEEQRRQARLLAKQEGKPDSVIERIVEGKLQKFYDDACLLRQPYIRDDSKTVGDVLREMIATTRENITIRRFVRWAVGESA